MSSIPSAVFKVSSALPAQLKSKRKKTEKDCKRQKFVHEEDGMVGGRGINVKDSAFKTKAPNENMQLLISGTEAKEYMGTEPTPSLAAAED